jgi:mannose-6-phosphate isomerase-like protein (cupin superfamily)
MSTIQYIKKQQARVVDLGTKKILKYTGTDRKLEINHMYINGRHPDNPGLFIFESDVAFMVFILKGNGRIYCNDTWYTVEPEDVIEVPPKTKFAAEGNDFEYLTVEHPAWYPEQASIVDDQGNKVEQTTK